MSNLQAQCFAESPHLVDKLPSAGSGRQGTFVHQRVNALDNLADQKQPLHSGQIDAGLSGRRP